MTNKPKHRLTKYTSVVIRMKYGRYLATSEKFLLDWWFWLFILLQVERNFEDFIKLDQELRTKYGSNLKSFPNGENVELNELEEYFNQVLTIGEKDFWQTEALFSFLDTCTEKSIIRDIQMKSMREKVLSKYLIRLNCRLTSILCRSSLWMASVLQTKSNT